MTLILFVIGGLRRLLVLLVSKCLHQRSDSLLYQVIQMDTEFWKGNNNNYKRLTGINFRYTLTFRFFNAIKHFMLSFLKHINANKNNIFC